MVVIAIYLLVRFSFNCVNTILHVIFKAEQLAILKIFYLLFVDCTIFELNDWRNLELLITVGYIHFVTADLLKQPHDVKNSIPTMTVFLSRWAAAHC